MHLRKGLRFEERAREYLEDRGLRPLRQNYSCRFGEIDLIMRDHETVCFIEVKFRKTMAFGGAAYSIPTAKQRKIVKAALFFIADNKNIARAALRFDALLIQRQVDGNDRYDWIRSAFYAE